MKSSPTLRKPLPLISFALHRIFKAVELCHKLKALRNGLSNFNNKPTEVTYELLTHGGKAFHKHRNQLIPFCPKEPLLFPHIQSNNERNPELFHDCDTSDMIQSDL